MTSSTLQPSPASSNTLLSDALYRYFSNGDMHIRQRRIPHPDPLLNTMLNDDYEGDDSDSRYHKAAVLIPVQRGRPGCPDQVLFTVRTDHLSRHAGQVSFPGGRCDPGDGDAITTALRESEEEIGLDPDSVEILGHLGDIFLPSGYQVTPVVGLFDAGQKLVPSPHEVAEIFLTPASLVLNPVSYQRSTHRYQGSEHQILELYFGEHRIWGATANMLFHLGQELAQQHQED